MWLALINFKQLGDLVVAVINLRKNLLHIRILRLHRVSLQIDSLITQSTLTMSLHLRISSHEPNDHAYMLIISILAFLTFSHLDIDCVFIADDKLIQLRFDHLDLHQPLFRLGHCEHDHDGVILVALKHHGLGFESYYQADCVEAWGKYDVADLTRAYLQQGGNGYEG